MGKKIQKAKVIALNAIQIEEEKMIKFFHCEKCGSLVVKVNDAKCNPVCCGQDMVELKANTTDAAQEKHVPVISRDGNKVHVEVGSTLHPMEEEHYIEFIAVVQGEMVQLQTLEPGQEPKADFLVQEGPVVAYEFCNKHGLWKAEA